jgi:hypothetical protein
LVALLLALPASALAEPPANDAFEDAAVITGSIAEEPGGARYLSVNTGGSNLDATTELDEPGTDAVGASVWYVFTPPEAATYQFAISCCAAAASLVLELFSGGSVGSLTPLATEAPFNEASLGAGETAYIRIAGPIDEGTQEPLAAAFEFTAVGQLASLPRPSLAGGTGNPPPPPVTPDTSIALTVISQQARRARFFFSATVAGSSFQCKLDKGDFKPCSSPRAYKHLKPGRHAFRVRAVGPTGLLDESAAVGRFAIAEPQRRR